MGINIKNEETNKAIKELAALTGNNLTQTIDYAVREQLRQSRHQQKKETLAEDLLAIGRRLTAKMKKPLPTMKELDDMMYDEDGLPK